MSIHTPPPYDYAEESREMRHALGIETPEEKIGRLEAEVHRLLTEKAEWKRRALRTDKDGVLPSWIDEQREAGWPDMHPEDYCHKCGRVNANWAYPGDWEAVTGTWAAETGREGICCIPCFIEMHEAMTGERHTWLLEPCGCGCQPSEVQP